MGEVDPCGFCVDEASDYVWSVEEGPYPISSHHCTARSDDDLKLCINILNCI